MKPRPAVMPSAQVKVTATERCAPAMPPNMPAIARAWYCSRAGRQPAAYAAAGLSPTARKPVILFALACGALFTGIIGTLGAIYVYELDPDQVSPELEWPSWMIYLCIPLGSYLMSFRFLQVMWRFQRTGQVPHQGHHGIEYVAPEILPAPVAEPAR